MRNKPPENNVTADERNEFVHREHVWRRTLRWPSWLLFFPPARPVSAPSHPELSGHGPGLPPHRTPRLSCPPCSPGRGCAGPGCGRPYRQLFHQLQETKRDVFTGCKITRTWCKCKNIRKTTRLAGEWFSKRSFCTHRGPLCPETELLHQTDLWRTLCLEPLASPQGWITRWASPEEETSAHDSFDEQTGEHCPHFVWDTFQAPIMLELKAAVFGIFVPSVA